MKVFSEELDRLIPAFEAVPLQGRRFSDFEDQVEALARRVVPVVLQERVALEPHAQVESPGRCPFCGSDRVYLKREVTEPELHSPQGAVAIRKQHARCRACDRTFSPSRS
jgi:hypothetical protein